jgi:diguanylate cyclase (GGDEF)-like protein
MQIDASTVLLSGIFIKLLLGCLFLIFWLHDRRSVWFGWWSVTYFVGTGIAVIFLSHGFGGRIHMIGVGAAGMVLAFGLLWQASRTFHGLPPLWWPVAGAVGLWTGACFLPGFLDHAPARVVLSSGMLTVLIALSAFEFWRGREERLMSRWPIIAILTSLSLFFAARVVFINILPFPLGAGPARQDALAIFNLAVFFHTLLLTVLFVAISKERLELKQRLNAQTDSLTGALNRRALMSRGDRILARHEYEDASLCLLLLDLDNFKALNDHFGHAGGDEVLTKFVAVVNENIRPTDFLFRLGGEEFCCLLPHTPVQQAETIAERVRLQVERAIALVGGNPVKTTVSVGVASTETCGYDLDSLMHRADAALYAAKRQGRNRVLVADMASISAVPVLTSVLAARTSVA